MSDLQVSACSSRMWINFHPSSIFFACINTNEKELYPPLLNMLTSDLSRFHKSTFAKTMVQKGKKKIGGKRESIFTSWEMCIYLEQQLTFLKKDIFRQVVFLLIMNYHSAPSFWAFPAHKYEDNAVAQRHAKFSYNHWKLVLKKHLEVIVCTKLFISITNTTWETLHVCVCVFGGQGGGLPGNMLGDGKIQMKKRFLSSWINKYYPERLSGLAEVICLVAGL